MRNFAIASIAINLLVTSLAFGLGADHSNEPIINDRWPKGLAELVNADNRVHGYFVNAQDVFFFRGETPSLNAFLTRYSQLPDTKLHVVLHPGKLEAKSPWDKQPRDIEADWKLFCTTPFTREQVQADSFKHLNRTLRTLTGSIKPDSFVTRRDPFVTRLDVWLGGSVKFDELRVPRNVLV